MFIEKKTKNNLSVTVFVSWPTEKRLRTTCYRGPSQKLAGNFMAFASSESLLANQVVLQALLAEVESLWEHRHFGTRRFTITYPDFIGWESTAPLAKYTQDNLEQFKPNDRSYGLRIKSECAHLHAPKTKEITISLELKSEGDSPLAIIHSVYPGVNIGKLTGDVTEREQRIFFTWNHPGED